MRYEYLIRYCPREGCPIQTIGFYSRRNAIEFWNKNRASWLYSEFVTRVIEDLPSFPYD